MTLEIEALVQLSEQTRMCAQRECASLRATLDHWRRCRKTLSCGRVYGVPPPKSRLKYTDGLLSSLGGHSFERRRWVALLIHLSPDLYGHFDQIKHVLALPGPEAAEAFEHLDRHGIGEFAD